MSAAENWYHIYIWKVSKNVQQSESAASVGMIVCNKFSAYVCFSFQELSVLMLHKNNS